MANAADDAEQQDHGISSPRGAQDQLGDLDRHPAQRQHQQVARMKMMNTA
jgi:hypothetical protein